MFRSTSPASTSSVLGFSFDLLHELHVELHLSSVLVVVGNGSICECVSFVLRDRDDMLRRPPRARLRAAKKPVAAARQQGRPPKQRTLPESPSINHLVLPPFGPSSDLARNDRGLCANVAASRGSGPACITPSRAVGGVAFFASCKTHICPLPNLIR